MNSFKHIIKPLFSESIYNLITDENKLVFQVRRTSNKHQIKQAIEQLYKIRIQKVNTLITPYGTKKAIVTLTQEFHANDIAAELNLF